MGNLAGSWLLLDKAEMAGEFGLYRLGQVAEFADKLDASAVFRTTHPSITSDLRRAASELRQLVLWLRCAMSATEDDAVISFDIRASW